MTLEAASADGSQQSVEGAWRGAEAYHFWLLAHRQLYEGSFDAARTTATVLGEYDDVLDPVDVHSFAALASFYSRHYGRCSKAFIKLESMPAVPPPKREQYADLAVAIFTRHPPTDPSARKKKGQREEARESGFGNKIGLNTCVASGRELGAESQVRCKICRHASITSELGGRISCPLCHSKLPAKGSGVIAPPGMTPAGKQPQRGGGAPAAATTAPWDM